MVGPAAAGGRAQPGDAGLDGCQLGAPPSGGSGLGPRREDVLSPVLGALFQNGQLQPDGYGPVKLATTGSSDGNCGRLRALPVSAHRYISNGEQAGEHLEQCLQSDLRPFLIAWRARGATGRQR